MPAWVAWIMVAVLTAQAALVLFLLYETLTHGHG